MSTELHLPPIRRVAAPQPKQDTVPQQRPGAAVPPALLLPVAKAPAALLPSHELSAHNLQLSLLQARVLSALSAHFGNFYTSYLSKAAGSTMHGVVKDDVLYLPLIYANPSLASKIGVRRIVLNLASQHEKISITAQQFNSIKEPDAHVWVCFSKAVLGSIVAADAPRHVLGPGPKADVVSAELVLKNKANGKETGEEITLFIALAC